MSKKYFKLMLQSITVIVANILHVTAIKEKAEKPKLHYILLWTTSDILAYQSLEQTGFKYSNCKYQNCYLTNNASYLSNVVDFDAILFDAVSLRQNPDLALPKRRSKNQRYIFVSTQPSVLNPITAEYNNFFNWTWTYKLDSDIRYTHIVIRDKEGKVIGPSKEMHWMPLEEMEPTSDDVISKLKDKKTAATWIVSNCDPKSQVQVYISKLQEELKKYKLNVDLYGSCESGNLQPCTKDLNKSGMSECEALIMKNYYFYLAFENFLSEDYVTKDLLVALKNFAVPVVFGGANHTRFMPDGIYLDALQMGPEKTAKQMNDIINNPKAYHDMFKWHKYYRYHDPRDSPDTDSICSLCAALNEKNGTSTYKNIVKWFNERKDWNAMPVSKIKRSTETKDDKKEKNVLNKPEKPKPYVAINIKYPPRPTWGPNHGEEDPCSVSMLSCLKGTFKSVWDSLRIES